MPRRFGKALAYATLIWIVGFGWGSIVFMTPSLKNYQPVPYISSNPAISFPILLFWLPLTYLLAANLLQRTADKRKEGLKLGLTFSVLNLILDLGLIVLLLKAGFAYFISLTVWLGYLLLLIIPWLTGRLLEAKLR